jgi:asparagine synthase (glutamine-hydrolysing)
MCGIAGFVSRADSAAAERSVGLMTDAMARRGPDSAGTHGWEHRGRDPGTVCLGHRRLAIFDLSAAGHQPMLTPDARLGLVFNGAIYNFHELRRELESAGCRFVSQTDTEVILLGYRVWGIDTLTKRLDGMFAFALWDDERDRLFLVRDRLGVKPLYYARRPEGMAFASSPRALRAAEFCGELDPMAVAEFLEYGYVSEERCIYAGVRKLPPASILEVQGDVIAQRRYWSLTADRRSTMSFEVAVDETERLLLDATRKRLFADVPVGALLSGGVDSALVCWAIKELGADITAYSVAVPGDAADESADAVATAREIGIRHEILPMSGMGEASIDELVSAFGEPFACASALGMLRLSRAIAHSPAKVLLTGDGGDDAFLGYDRHRMLLRIQRTAALLPGASTTAWRSLRSLLPREGLARRVKHFVDYHVGGLGAFLSATDGLPALARHGMLGPRLAGLRVPARDVPWSVASARGLLQNYLDYDLGHQFVSEYLAKVDGATMHYALEARSPFLDVGLWEHADRLPFNVLLHGGQLKALLRAVAARRISPRVATGAKRGFSIPVERWVAGAWADSARDHFAESLLDARGWVRKEAVLADLASARNRRIAPTRLWYLYVLEAWMRSEGAVTPALVAAARP